MDNGGKMLQSRIVARRLGIAVTTLKKWRRRNQGPPFYRLSYKAVRYDADDVERWRQQRRKDTQ